jgi:hypothetical protein
MLAVNVVLSPGYSRLIALSNNLTDTSTSSMPKSRSLILSLFLQLFILTFNAIVRFLSSLVYRLHHIYNFSFGQKERLCSTARRAIRRVGPE